MLDIQAAIRSLLISSSDLTALLATYNSSPAIFTGDLVPEGSGLPYVVINAPFSVTKNETIILDGFDYELDIAVIGKKTLSSVQIDDISMIIYRLLISNDINIDGYITRNISARPPINLETDSEVVGRNIQYSISLLEEQ